MNSSRASTKLPGGTAETVELTPSVQTASEQAPSAQTASVQTASVPTATELAASTETASTPTPSTLAVLEDDPRAAALRAFAATRAPGQTLVAVGAADAAPDWAPHGTPVMVCTDDAPFLVDSVVAALARQGLTAQELAHPVVAVERGADGSLVSVGAPGGAPESWISVVVERLESAEARAELAERLTGVVADVHRAASDWEEMRRVCRDIADELRAAAPQTVDPLSVDPTIEFLTWLAADNFTFLGYREHTLDTADDGEGAAGNVGATNTAGTDTAGTDTAGPAGTAGTADAAGAAVLRALPETGLGILAEQGPSVTRLGAAASRTARDPRLLTITKANTRSTVHRDAYLDYIGIRTFDEHGRVTGERRFLGLFTAAAAAAPALSVPIIAPKLRRVLNASGVPLQSHSGRDLLRVLEDYPRDELLQDSAEHLLEVVTEVSRLPERGRVRTFVRPDEFGRFVSVLVFMPRDHYSTAVRLRIEALLSETYAATSVDSVARIGESPLAQLHVVVRTAPGRALPAAAALDPATHASADAAVTDAALTDAALIEAALTEAELTDPPLTGSALNELVEQAVRSWAERLSDALAARAGEPAGARVFARYADAFPAAYRETVDPGQAVSDIGLLEQLEDAACAVRLGRPDAADPTRRTFTFASREQHPLTQVLPVLTDLGVDVIDERPYVVTLPGGELRHLSEFGLRGPDEGPWGDPEWGALFDEAFAAVWAGEAESDRLQSLVLLAGLGWRRIVILRAVAMYLTQIGSTFSVDYIEQAVTANPAIAAALVRLFGARFDPALDAPSDRASGPENDTASGSAGEPAPDTAPDTAPGVARGALIAAEQQRLDALLAEVASLDHDRILRALAGIITATWRTNFYQVLSDGAPKPWVALKLDCSRVPDLPAPRPMAEIWVYAPEVEGVHMRFGAVARGGLRWSDRREDFRTEVLGLVKAQMVKNAVIVPTGSKGGFVAKRLPSPSDRAAWLAGGRSAYATFIRGLLDVTDNRDGDRIVPPAALVRHDGDDSYLVVAADKGTAGFSDLANSVAEEYGFWLGDAFASGGSAGYDHKALGITARGAWESVKRHFRELGHDTAATDFTVVGVGDMSGDVFGNGMLRSEHIRLVAAFDHRHVFVDPEPDARATFAERRRLFELPGSSWDDFDRSLMSAGGGVFPLTAKQVDVTPEMRAALGLSPAVLTLTPAELKRAVLLAPVDLIWNGAIGTYIKASDESHAAIGDRANDAVRVNGNELRARVVGEGGNLGASQRGRVEAARAGVRLNTDAIDNSAGVGTSDREVNLKILLGLAEQSGDLTRAERDALLQSMTDEVAAGVLRDNYEQNVLLGNSRATAVEMLPSHERLIGWLEERGALDRDLESLPSEAEVAELVRTGRGLTRPEFAVLVAYAKITLKDDLALTELADDPWFSRTLAEYVPEPLRERYADELAAHPLRREIIVNSVVNSLVNRGGITFAYRAADETGASQEEIARAFVVAREVFGMQEFVDAVEATDNRVPTEVQTDLYLSFRRLLDRATRWLVQHRGAGIDITREVATFRDEVLPQTTRMGELLAGADRERFSARAAAFARAGVPEALAARGAGLLESLPLLDISERSRLAGWEFEAFAELYFALAERVSFDALLERVSALPQGDRWGSMARAALRDDLYGVMVDLAATVAVATGGGSAAPESTAARIDAWIAAGGAAAARALAEAGAATRADPTTGLATVSVALRRLRSLVTGG